MGVLLNGRAARGLAAAMALLLTPGCAVWRSGGLVDRSQPIGGACRTFEIAGGAEDLAVDGRGGVYVSVSDWRARQRGERPARGRLYRLELDGGVERLRDVTPAAPADLQPHGIDVWTAPDGGQRLFVVNHPVKGPSRVEILDVTPAGLTDSGEGGQWDSLHRPNDIAAFGPRSFFATNDHGLKRKAWFSPRWIETVVDVTGWPNGYVVRVTEGVAAVVSGKLSLPNGIALSPDGGRLYVAESAMGRVRVFDDLSATQLREVGRLDPGPGPDNISVDAAGDLWIGAHNNGADFLRHVRWPTHPSPGRVVRLSPSGARQVVYQSGRSPPPPGGPLLWTVSAGVPDGRGGVVIGAIFPHQLQHCALQATAARR